MLSFTPEVEEVLAFFRHTHEITTNGMGAVWFRRVSLPFEGGVHDQPARLMQQLDWVEHLWNEQLAEQLREKREKANGDG